MASFTGELQDFYDLIGPKISNDIATMTKKKKIGLGYICQFCHQKNELDAAHRHGRSRRDIIKNVLEDHKLEDRKYQVSNLRQLIKTVKEAHFPIEDSFYFLCKKCHRKYDNEYKVKNQNLKNQSLNKQSKYTTLRLSGYIESDYEQEFLRLISSNYSLKDSLKELFVKFSYITITSTKLRKIWEKKFPNTNSQKVTDYLWNLEKEGFLIKTSRSNYKASNKIKNKTIKNYDKPTIKITQNTNTKKRQSKPTQKINQTLGGH